jgi:tetratricopeptide (TPR) repeat protein
MERSRFPGTLELITGKFLRHSPEFYEWRIKKRLDADPTNAALLDDLAVAYDKTGQHEKAIETALKTEKFHPGRYETASNLATFLFHAGRPEEGIPHVERALKINPDAHFGREKYQKFLTEYVVARRTDGTLKLPMAKVAVYEKASQDKIGAHDHTTTDTFTDFLKTKGLKQNASHLENEEVRAAVKGVAGMMRFAKHDSPVLLEALGLLLSHREWASEDDAKQLAARAFLRASYEVPDGPNRVLYRRMAAGALAHQSSPSGDHHDMLGTVETAFQKELEEGRVWYADLRERELSWIRDGKNPEAEFDKLYDSEPEVSGMDVRDPLTPPEQLRLLLIGAGVVCALALLSCLVGIALVIRHIRRDRAARNATRSAEPS